MFRVAEDFAAEWRSIQGEELRTCRLGAAGDPKRAKYIAVRLICQQSVHTPCTGRYIREKYSSGGCLGVKSVIL